MRYLYLLLLASLGAHAAETYAIRGDVRSAMDAHARAANLQPLKDAGEDALRVWVLDYMLGRTEGFVISKGNAIRCTTSYRYADDTITVERARCRPWHRGWDALDALDSVSALDGKRWDCPMFDGSNVYVEGVRNKKRFAFEVSNPYACDDADSKAVMGLLEKL